MKMTTAIKCQAASSGFCVPEYERDSRTSANENVDYYDRYKKALERSLSRWAAEDCRTDLMTIQRDEWHKEGLI